MPVDILTRTEKGIRLELSELDQNLTDLQDACNASHKETMTVDTDTVLTINQRIILVNAAVGIVNLELPSVLTSLDHEFVIKKIDSSANVVNLNTYNTDAIEGTTQLILTSQWEVLRVVSNGTSWYVI